MRVAFIITQLEDVGGAQIHVRDLSLALKSLGHEVFVLAGANGAVAAELSERGVEFCSVRHLARSIRPVKDIRATLDLRRQLRRIQPDVISTHMSKAGLLGRIAGRSLDIPTVSTAHGWRFALERPPASWLVKTIERWAAHMASRIITVCEADRAIAVDSRVAKPDRLLTIHNAMPDVNARLRARPAESPPRLLMVARFVKQKDHPTLLKALAGLRELDWRLDLVGEGPLRPSAEKMVASLGLRDRVSFLGTRRDVAQLMARSQVFVLTAHWEGFPRSILEAMRAGLPVVASEVGGVGESVTDGETGFLVPAQDADRLRDCLRTIIGDNHLRARMGQAARARYEDHFTFDRLVERTLRLYETVCRENDASGGNSVTGITAEATARAEES